MEEEELEAIVQLCHGCSAAITEMWWGDCHDWSTKMDSYKHFRKDREGWRGGGVALYGRE